jgi:hypothetical protein
VVTGCFMLAILLGAAAPPETGTVHGSVRVAETLEAVPHATITIPALGRSGASDGRGYWVITGVPAGRHRVVAEALGHEPGEAEVDVPAGGSVRVDLVLAVRPIALGGLDVRGRAPTLHSEAGPPPARITLAELRSTPSLVERDVLRVVQALPSVRMASDFSSALYIRGGSPDQTAVTLDGVPLFNPYHLGGLFGAVNPDIVAGVDVWPGAMPATGEDRISGAVAIRTRDGGRDRVRGQGGVGLLSSRLSLDGPLPGARGSYLVSVRRTYLDLFTDALYRMDLTDVTLPYAFTDAYFKVTQDVGAAGSVIASTYITAERFVLPEGMQREFGSRMDFAWGSRVGSIAYRHLLTPALVGEVRIAATTFQGDFDAAETHFFGPDDEFHPVFESWSRVRNRIGSVDLTWHGRRHRVRAGGRIDDYGFRHHLARAASELDSPIPAFHLSQRLRTAAAYVEDEWTPSPDLSLRGGIRVLHGGDRGTALMPRLGARWSVTPHLALSFGAGRYAQVIQSLRDEEAAGTSVLAYDLPAAIERELGLSTAHDVVVGTELERDGFALRLDGYWKWMDAIPLPPAPRGDILDLPMIVPHGFLAASGSARGIEATARRMWRDANLTIAYAVAVAEREVDGERFLTRFDRRHSLDANLVGPTAGRWGRWSARYQLATGQPYTPILGGAYVGPYDPGSGLFDSSPRWRFIVGDHNSARLPGYSRLDVGGRWELRRGWFGRDMIITPQVNVMNLLNTRNVLVALPSQGYGSPPVLNYAPQLPFFPSIAVDFSW